MTVLTLTPEQEQAIADAAARLGAALVAERDGAAERTGPHYEYPLETPATAHALTLIARRAGRWRWSRTVQVGANDYFEATGGAQVMVRRETAAQYGINTHYLQARLKPGWIAEQVAALVVKLAHQILGQYPDDLVSQRNAVYLRFERATLTEAQDAEIVRLERDEGRTPMYDTMTLDDTRFWLAWADAQGLPAPVAPVEGAEETNDA